MIAHANQKCAFFTLDITMSYAKQYRLRKWPLRTGHSYVRQFTVCANARYIVGPGGGVSTLFENNIYPSFRFMRKVTCTGPPLFDPGIASASPNSSRRG